jgi:hypothetical protein
MAVPNAWTVRKRGAATLVRSPDRLLVVTFAADRSETGRNTPAAKYARRAFTSLPGFARLKARAGRRVVKSPYESRRIDGTGRLRARKQKQCVTVTSFRRPGRVTYTAVVFGAHVGRCIPHQGALRRLLSSFRARPPEA